MQKGDRCQRQSSLVPSVKNEMQSAPVSPHVTKQVGLDLCYLLQVDGHRHLNVCNDHFTKLIVCNGSA